MTANTHPGFDLLERAHVVLITLQAAIIASLMIQMGLEDVPSGIVILVAATCMIGVVNRKLASDRYNRNAAGWIVAWRMAALATLAAITLAVFLYPLLPSGVPEFADRAVISLLWVVICLKGAAVGKLRPGGMIGLRVYWTMRSRLAWERAHRTLGRFLFWGGLIGLVTSLSVTPPASLVLLAALVTSAVARALIESWQVWRVDPERTQRSA